jgi:hypothetical protein
LQPDCYNHCPAHSYQQGTCQCLRVRIFICFYVDLMKMRHAVGACRDAYNVQQTTTMERFKDITLEFVLEGPLHAHGHTSKYPIRYCKAVIDQVKQMILLLFAFDNMPSISCVNSSRVISYHLTSPSKCSLSPASISCVETLRGQGCANNAPARLANVPRLAQVSDDDVGRATKSKRLPDSLTPQCDRSGSERIDGR